MELYLEYLVGFLYLVGFDEPLDGEEGGFYAVVGGGLLVHVLVDVEMFVLLLECVRDVVSEVGL